MFLIEDALLFVAIFDTVLIVMILALVGGVKPTGGDVIDLKHADPEPTPGEEG